MRNFLFVVVLSKEGDVVNCGMKLSMKCDPVPEIFSSAQASSLEPSTFVLLSCRRFTRTDGVLCWPSDANTPRSSQCI